MAVDAPAMDRRLFLQTAGAVFVSVALQRALHVYSPALGFSLRGRWGEEFAGR